MLILYYVGRVTLYNINFIDFGLNILSHTAVYYLVSNFIVYTTQIINFLNLNNHKKFYFTHNARYLYTYYYNMYNIKSDWIKNGYIFR